MNIFLRELKANRKALIIWSVCMVLFVIMGMQKYEALLGSGASITDFNKMMETMPKVLKTMWGLSNIDITKPIGYFSVLFPYIVLICGIHAGMIGTNIISKEERDKTVEFLMVKPVSRSKIITSKIMAAITNVVVVNLATYIPLIFILKNMTTEKITLPLILATISTFFIQLLFMFIGVGMATMSKNYKKTGSITVGILLGTYFLSLIIDMSEKLEIFSFLTPFKYFDAKDFLITNKLNVGYVILTFAIILAVIIPSYRRYTKRDLNF